MAASESSLEPLASLASFVTNSASVVRISELNCSRSVASLCDLVSSVEIERLVLQPGLPAPPEALAKAIKGSRIHTLVAGSYSSCSKRRPILLRLVLSSLGPRLGKLELFCVEIHLGLGKVLPHCTSLTNLTIVRCDAADRSIVEDLARGMIATPTLEAVHFACNDLRDFEVQLLSTKALAKLPRLRKLRLCNENFGTNGCDALRQIPTLPRLQTLDLAQNHIDDVSALLGMIPPVEAGSHSKSSALETLILSWNGIGPAAGKLETLLLRCPNLTVLEIAGNPVGVAAAGKIGRAVGEVQMLRRLNISRCDLGSAGVAALLGPMNGCPLEALRMERNTAGDQGAKAVSGCLQSRGRIVELCVSGNEITQEGALELAKILRISGMMRSLDLSGNCIGPGGAVAVCEALRGWFTMQDLNLGHCEIGDIGATAVSEAIARVGCRRVNLESNGIHSLGARTLASAVASTPLTLVELLKLDDNPIDDSGAVFIADTLIRANRVIRELRIHGIDLGDEGAKAIVDAVQTRNVAGPLRMLVVKGKKCGAGGRRILEELKKRERLANTGLTISVA